MAGRGPQPKDSGTKRRRNKDPMGMRIIEIEPISQPALPTVYFHNEEGERKRFYWPTVTKAWWKMWKDSPLSEDFTETDWSELRDTALLHARFWMGETKVASEIRLRTAKFGATPEDRARLRIQFAVAENIEGSNERGDVRQAAGTAPAPAQDPRLTLQAVN